MSTAGSGLLPVQIGQILHIGAGYGTDLPAYRAEGAQAITLVEPDPDALSALYDIARDAPDVTLIGSAVSAKGGAGMLHRFSFGDLNSLRKPTGLWQIFPGLEEVSREAVSIIDPVTLVDQLRLAEDVDHMLVIEAPGEGFDILTALHAADRLCQFTSVRVQDGSASLYEGSGNIASIAALLEGAGFTNPALRDDSDPDRPVLTARFDRVGALRKELAAQQDQNAEIKAAQVRAAAELDDALSAQQSAHAEETARRQSAEAARASLEVSLASAQSGLSDLRAQVAREQTARQTAQDALTGAKADLEDLRDQLRDEQTARAEAATARQSAEAELAKLRDELTGEQAARAQDAANHATTEAALVKYEDALARAEGTLSEQSEELSAEKAARSAEASKRQAAETALATRAQEAKQSADREAQLNETCTSLRKQLAELQAARAAQDTRLSELERALVARTQELEHEKAGFAEKDTRLRAEAEALRQRLKAAEDNIAKEADTARIALRMQALTLADLAQLQRRFGVLRAEKDSQDALLLKVTQRLADAADYLKTLQLPGDGPEQLPGAGPDLALNIALAQQSPDATAKDTPKAKRARTRKGQSKKAKSGKGKT